MAAKRYEVGLRSLEGADLVTASKIALGWMAARQWRAGLVDGQPDYWDVNEQYIVDAAGVV